MIGGWEAKDKRTRLEGFQKGEGGGGARGEGLVSLGSGCCEALRCDGVG
jgi:hypothetical protein